ncbi:hypothetical protein [Azonexus sp.]|uniref:hypothetical protein n=1 Tax=Azonexus sp. TaxID=1872668 RepID=UPI0039E3397A
MDNSFLAFALVTSLLLAGGGTLLLVGYINTLPAALAQHWRIALPVVLLPVAGPLWYAWRSGEEFRRARWQLIAALVLLALAAVVILALGPYFAERLVAEMAETAKMR